MSIAIPSIFGLTHAQMKPFVQKMAGEPIADYKVDIEHEPQGFPGWAGEKLIPTFRWRTERGHTGETVVCVKKMREPGMHEARHYAYLHAHDFPACALYGVGAGPHSEEILFLEYLDRFWPGGSAPEERRLDILAQRAWLNALPITDEYRSMLWNSPMGREWLEPGAAERVLTQIWDAADAGEIGDTLAEFCRRHRAAVPRLSALAVRLSEQVASMPQTLLNGEFCPGCPPGSDTPRGFDVHSTRIGPRFGDLVDYLSIPEGVHTLWGSDSWQPRQKYAAHYAGELARHGGPKVSAATVLAECDILWQAHAFSLEWILWLCKTGEVIWTPDREQGKEQTRSSLHSILSYLIKQI